MEKVNNPEPTPGVDVCNLEDHEAKREERRLRHWVIKVCVLTMAAVFVATVVSMLWAFLVRGDAINGTIIESFLKAATEIIKFMNTPTGQG